MKALIAFLPALGAVLMADIKMEDVVVEDTACYGLELRYSKK